MMVDTESDLAGESTQGMHPFPTSHTISFPTTAEARVASAILMLCDRIGKDLSRIRKLREDRIISKKELGELEDDLVKEIDTWAIHHD